MEAGLNITQFRIKAY